MIIAIYISDKEPISTIYKELSKYHNKETNNPSPTKMGKLFGQTIHQRHKYSTYAHEKMLNIAGHYRDAN